MSRKIRASYDPVLKEVHGEKKPVNLDKYGVGHLLYNSMQKYAQKGYTAQIDAATGYKDSVKDLLIRSVRTALTMREMGIMPDDIIMICSYNHLQSIVPYVASQLIGAIMTASDPMLSLEDTKHLVNLVKPKMIFVSDGSESLITQAVESCDLKTTIVTFSKCPKYQQFYQFLRARTDEDQFLPYKTGDLNKTTVILFSSGTTGLPKGMCLSHYYLFNCMTGFSDIPGDSLQLTILGFASMYWISALMIVTASLTYGYQRLVCASYQPEHFWRNLQKYEVHYVFTAPVQAIKAIPYMTDTKSEYPKVFLIGGSSIAPNYLKHLKEKLPQTCVSVGYGQTEVGYISTFKPEDNFNDNLKSCGFPAPNLILKIVNPETEERLDQNKIGELRVKGGYQMNGYYKEDSSKCWDSEGFLKTGDLGYFDNNLCFYITDRVKEMFKYMSWHIVPAKLENVLYTHPDVQLACVVGVPHPTDDNHPMGLVTLLPGSTVSPEELELYVEERVDDRNRLRAGVKILSCMPLTATGKIKRQELRKNLNKYVI